MASKCWFVLRQAHYPPPVFPKNGIGAAKGAICLGHVIPDLEHLDNVINTRGPMEFPPDMPVYPSKAWDLTWEAASTNEAAVEAGAGAPVAALAGLEIKLDAGVAFRKSVKNCAQFARLETFIIQPTGEYIEDTVEDDQVAKYVEKHTVLCVSKSMFMITGIIIARGAKTSRIESQARTGHGGPGFEFPGVAELSLDASLTHETGTSSAAERRSDFVWAVRLAKIKKGILDGEWSHTTFAKGASFGIGEEEGDGENLVKALEEEGLTGIKEADVGQDDDVFLV